MNVCVLTLPDTSQLCCFCRIVPQNQPQRFLGSAVKWAFLGGFVAYNHLYWVIICPNLCFLSFLMGKYPKHVFTTVHHKAVPLITQSTGNIHNSVGLRCNTRHSLGAVVVLFLKKKLGPSILILDSKIISFCDKPYTPKHTVRTFNPDLIIWLLHAL